MVVLKPSSLDVNSDVGRRRYRGHCNREMWTVDENNGANCIAEQVAEKSEGVPIKRFTFYFCTFYKQTIRLPPILYLSHNIALPSRLPSPSFFKT